MNKHKKILEETLILAAEEVRSKINEATDEEIILKLSGALKLIADAYRTVREC